MNERDFDLNNTLWAQYLEWCDGGYLVRDAEGLPVAVKTEPSLKDFEVWKQGMGYYVGQVEDD